MTAAAANGCLLIAGMADEAARQGLEAILSCRVYQPSVARHTRLTPLAKKYFPRIELLLLCSRWSRKGTRNLARAARQQGIRVYWLPGGLNPAAVQHQMKL